MWRTNLDMGCPQPQIANLYLEELVKKLNNIQDLKQFILNTHHSVIELLKYAAPG